MNNIKRPGAFRKKAKKAKMSTSEYADKVLKSNSESSLRTKKQASISKTLSRLRNKRGA